MPYPQHPIPFHSSPPPISASPSSFLSSTYLTYSKPPRHSRLVTFPLLPVLVLLLSATLPTTSFAVDAGSSAAAAAFNTAPSTAAIILVGIVGLLALVLLSAIQALLRHVPPLKPPLSPRILRPLLVLIALAASAYIAALFIDFCFALNTDLNNIRSRLATLLPVHNPNRVWYINADITIPSAHALLLITALFVVVQIVIMLLIFVCTELTGVAPVEHAKTRHDVGLLDLGRCVPFPCLTTSTPAKDPEQNHTIPHIPPSAPDSPTPSSPQAVSQSHPRPSSTASSPTEIHSPPETRSFTATDTTLVPSTASTAQPQHGGSPHQTHPSANQPQGSSMVAGQPSESKPPAPLARVPVIEAALNVCRRYPIGCLVMSVVAAAMIALVAFGSAFLGRAQYLEPEMVTSLNAQELAAINSTLLSRSHLISPIEVLPNYLCNPPSKLAPKCIVPPLPSISSPNPSAGGSVGPGAGPSANASRASAIVVSSDTSGNGSSGTVRLVRPQPVPFDGFDGAPVVAVSLSARQSTAGTSSGSSSSSKPSSLQVRFDACALQGGNDSALLAACMVGFDNATGRPAVPLSEALQTLVGSPFVFKSPYRAVLGFAIVCVISAILVTVIWTALLYRYGSRMCNVTFFVAGVLMFVPLAVTLAAVSAALLGGPVSTVIAQLSVPGSLIVFDPPLAYIIAGAGPTSQLVMNTCGAAIMFEFAMLFVAAVLHPRDIVLSINRITRTVTLSQDSLR